jgi:acyl carrier protein
MVPSTVTVLPELPLGPTGKIDRRALAASDAARPTRSAERVAPRTQDEERIARVWGEVLGLDEIGVHEDFFDLGGHSLLATRVVSRLRRTFDREIALRTLFEAPTVAELAAHLSGAGTPAGDAAAIEAIGDDVRSLDDLLAELDSEPAGELVAGE